MNKLRLLVSIPVETLKRLQDWNKLQPMAANARQLLGQAVESGQHIKPKLIHIPKGRKTLTVYLPIELYKALEDANDKAQLSFSSYITTILENQLNQHD